jgi:hypothetical protein
LKKYLISLVFILAVTLIWSGCSTPAPAPSTKAPAATTSAPITTTAAPATSANPTPSTTAPAKPSASATTQPAVSQAAVKTTAATPTVQKNWNLSEVQEWDTYKDVKAPYHTSWKGTEGDLISTITGDLPGNPISSINAKWTLPPTTMVAGSEYVMEFSVTAVNQKTANLGLEGSITSGLDVFNVLPDGATGARIKIIPDEKVPKILWNDATGTIKSGKFTFKAPDYGYANSKTTNKMTLTVKYYCNAQLAWRYIYEWAEKPLTVVRTVGTFTIP